MTKNDLHFDAETKDTLKNIEHYLKILVMKYFEPILQEELDTPEKKAVYKYTGEKTSREIAKISPLSQPTISRLWVRWEKRGLLKKEGQKFKKVL